MYMNEYYRMDDLFKRYPEGSPVFLPKRSMKIKNKIRRKRNKK